MSAPICVSINLCVYVSTCVLSIVSGCRSVCWLSVSCGGVVCFSFSQSVVLYLSVCLFACLCLSRSVSQTVSLFVCPLTGGQSSVFLSCQSVMVRTKRAYSGGEDAESERGEGYAHKSNRLRTQERQVGLMDVELSSAPSLRTEAESRGLRARG